MKVFDAHFHIIDYRYPIVENAGYTPPEFTIKDYKRKTKEFEIVGGAIVSGSFQAFDQSYLKDSIEKMGKDFVGVANIPVTISDEELEDLNQNGISAVRFNLKRGGSETIEHLPYLSNKLYEKYGWHTELYVDSKHLAELKPTLQQLPKFSIDHLGLSKTGLSQLYQWVEKGARVKATGFGRIDFDPILAMKQIHAIDPKALLFGTDLPSTRAAVPFSISDAQRIKSNFSVQDQERIFYKNAMEWYQKPYLSKGSISINNVCIY